ncbi:MAG: DNA internalization-related competence protein ComEC/Rec2, partial [Lachnospiraceae bacterium]|nr:DNA internalization-related competence protein ComEC/Rec2 [Lachnospiraceae bacterium]
MISLSNFEKLMCRPLILYTGAFILGIMCRGPGRSPKVAAAAMITAVILFIGGSILLTGLPSMRRPTGAGPLIFCTVWLICPLFCFAGYARTVETGIESNLKKALTGSSDATVKGIISDISIKNDGCVLTVSDCAAIIGQHEFQARKINIIISEENVTDPDCDYSIGDTVKAAGKLYPFESATNYGQFDSELYYRIRNTDAKLYASDVFVIPEETAQRSLPERFGYGIANKLLHIRLKLTEGIYAVLPQKEAGVLTAMLTGERGLLDGELKKLYSDGGIAHILSISALHVTLLGMGAFRLLIFMTSHLRFSGCFTILLMLMYGAMTGFSVSTQRAVIMLIVALTARMTGRAYDRLSGCGFAALLILTVRPLYVYDAGFKMSFAAVVGINTVEWVIEVYEIRKTAAKVILPCIAVWLFTLPVVMSTYFEISIYSLIVNPLILIFMAILLVSGMAAGGLGNLIFLGSGLRTVAGLFAGPVYFILKMYEGLCELELKLPYSKVVTGSPGKIWIIIYYSVLLAIMITVIRRKKPAALLGLVVCMCIFIRIQAPYEAYFIDVGQGDSHFLRCGGLNILIDGGSSNISDVAAYRMIPFMKYMGIQKIDTVIISHTDADHVNGILKILEEGYPSVGRIVTGVNVEEDDRVIAAAVNAGVPVIRAKAGDDIENAGDSFRITAVAPEENAGYKDKNSASLTVLVKYGTFSTLMTGDSGAESERRYIKRLGSAVTVLKVAHHGSRYSTSSELLRRIQPQVACISCSKTNSYGHPSP